MGTEVQTNSLPTGEGAPPSVQVPAVQPQAPVVGPQPVEPTPQYVSRDEFLRAIEETKRAAEERALELGKRGAQSLIDKSHLHERTKLVEGMLQALVQEGTLDQAQASQRLATAQMQALTDLLPDAEPPQQGTPQPQPMPRATPIPEAIDPLQAMGAQALAASGLQPTDPEYEIVTRPKHYPTFLAWYDALKEQQAAKQARLLRQQAAATVAQAPPPPPTATPPAPVPVEVGGGGAAPITDINVLRKQREKAHFDHNRAEFERISAEIEALCRSG